MPDHDHSQVFSRLADAPSGPSFDVFGPTIEFLAFSDDFCVLRGVVPPGVTVPMHRHADAEDFYIISGEVGRPVIGSLTPATSAEVAHFVDVAVSYGYELASAEENAAVGIFVAPLTAH
ncbi:MAG: cupin domain-containing protein [Actinomycetota bacterium]|nr:cupin domain-containing protein [Actinomycetota bacterium]